MAKGSGSAASTWASWHVPGHCADHLAFLGGTLQTPGNHSETSLVRGPSGRQAGSGRRLTARHGMGQPCTACCGMAPPHHPLARHDYGARPSSTVAWERASNPFLLCPDEDAFLRLKADWPRFKAPAWIEMIAIIHSCDRSHRE